MKKTLKYLLYICCIFITTDLSAQSKAGYERAGDESYRKHDPYNAITFYGQAMAYSEDAGLQLKMGNCYRELQDYSTALLWYNRTMANSKETQVVYATAALGAADMYKRQGNFTDAKRILNTIKNPIASDSLEISEQQNGILFAEKMMQDTLPFDLVHPGTIINSAYSDFAPVLSRDSTLYFSSLRFPAGSTPNATTGKIVISKIADGNYMKPEILPDAINHPSWNNANASISADGKLLLFTRCTPNEEELLTCAIYESKRENGKWKEAIRLNDSINLPGSTSTQPCIVTNLAEGYLLYFSSNRKNGYGKNDIWFCKRTPDGKYSSPLNAGPIVNSKYDEISPYYDIIEQTLWFSSNNWQGLGGYDIHAVNYSNTKADSIHSFGLPINSGYNDIYFSVSYTVPRQRYLASNRPPAAKMNGTSCCYDIFRIDTLIPFKPDSDSLVLASQPSVKLIPELPLSEQPVEKVLVSLNSMLPLRLYFDNDYPDPKTRKETTGSNYENLVNDYLAKLPDYEGAARDDSGKENIKIFFIDSVSANYKKLKDFTEAVYALLQRGTRLNLKIQGCASPLADNSYNVTLSKRRISSLRNFWASWNHGDLQSYINSGKLTLLEDPAGESLAEKIVSDQLNDKSASVYSTAAATERRIEVTEITLKQP